MSIVIERIVTAGIFSLDGEDFDVDNNVYVIGDAAEVIVIDAAHDHQPILETIGDRIVLAVLCTHGHNDHINAAAALADSVSAPIGLHPDDLVLWEMTYADRRPDIDLSHGDTFEVGGSLLAVLHTPGHSPGSCCLHLESETVLFSGDTLFPGGPGATGRSYSSRSLLLDSIEERLFTLHGGTRVLAGHGDETSIGAESPSLAEWREED